MPASLANYPGNKSDFQNRPHEGHRSDLSKSSVVEVNSVLMELLPPDSPALLEQAKEGSQEAFDRLCLAYEIRLLRQAILLCGDVSLAEDIVQETLIESWKSLRRYNGTCQFFTWLCAILHNRYRSRSRRKQILLFLGITSGESGTPNALADQVTDENGRPDKAAQLREQGDLVRRCVSELPPKQQQVIYLRFFVDDSLEGIAVALRCSVGTVKSRLYYALDKLRSMPELQEERGHCLWKEQAL
jgi:RNA polymerase sigma-70 factor, ECF subfamily